MKSELWGKSRVMVGVGRWVGKCDCGRWSRGWLMRVITNANECLLVPDIVLSTLIY